MKHMRKSIAYIFAALLSVTLLTGCSGYNKIMKASDYDTKYSLAKSMFIEGKYTNASSILEECVVMFRGTQKAEESMFLLASCYYNLGDYLSASQYFTACFRTFPHGIYSETCRFMSGKSLFLDMPDPRLDASSTFSAISELQTFVESFPYSTYRKEAENMIQTMYDRLAEKELGTAKLYYNMGNYLGNNFLSAIIVSQNALMDFPQTRLREEFAFLILKSRFQMAEESVQAKKEARYRDTIDEYYAFKNDYSDSKYMKDADKIFRQASKKVKETDKQEE